MATRICVFCSTTSGSSPAHLEAARSLAEVFHAQSIQLVYGGGTTGMMGELARTMVKLSGKDAVQGIIPRAVVGIERDVEEAKDEGDGKLTGWFSKLHKRGQRYSSDKGQTEAALVNEDLYGKVTIVRDLSERKREMARLVAMGGAGSGFVALTGGFGTMDEVMEVVTLYQFGVHKRRVCLYNVEGYWDGIGQWMEGAIEKGFVREEMREVVGITDTAEGCVGWLKCVVDGNRGIGMA
ncbi:MAG: hypothetical protein Q9217_002757 [Psora testacea]